MKSFTLVFAALISSASALANSQSLSPSQSEPLGPPGNSFEGVMPTGSMPPFSDPSGRPSGAMGVPTGGFNGQFPSGAPDLPSGLPISGSHPSGTQGAAFGTGVPSEPSFSRPSNIGSFSPGIPTNLPRQLPTGSESRVGNLLSITGAPAAAPSGTGDAGGRCGGGGQRASGGGSQPSMSSGGFRSKGANRQFATRTESRGRAQQTGDRSSGCGGSRGANGGGSPSGSASTLPTTFATSVRASPNA